MSEVVKKSKKAKWVWLVLLSLVMAAFYQSWYVWGPLRHNRAAVAQALVWFNKHQSEFDKGLSNPDPKYVQIPSYEEASSIVGVYYDNEMNVVIHINVKNSFVFLRPEINGENIVWHCKGHPAELVPAHCR